MKTAILAVTMLALSSPSYAQFGGVLDRAKQVKDTKDKIDELNITDEEERKIGEDVSVKVRARFGVVQDPAITKYVSLVGTNLARQSERPTLQWTFIVLDTDGVNAFASPGGFVHITRGALGLISNEAELSGVLAHEIGHVAHKHTVNAIRKNKAVQMGTNATLADRGPFLTNMANKAYEMVLENSFDRGDELDADKASVTYTKKVGYASGTLADFLTRLDDRNKDQPARNGLFASHPETKERIEKIRAMAGKGGATVEVRYKEHITYTPTPITSVAVVADGASGLTGSTAPSKDKDAKDADKKDDAPKKKGFGLGALKPGTAQESKSAQVSASGGARGVGPDRAAKGGSNPALVKVTVTDAELDTFKKGIA
jgi:beta-barrel assembly-enhancing protease